MSIEDSRRFQDIEHGRFQNIPKHKAWKIREHYTPQSIEDSRSFQNMEHIRFQNIATVYDELKLNWTTISGRVVSLTAVVDIIVKRYV